MMRPIVVIVSEYASDNLGDQAIAISLQAMLSPKCELKLVSFGGHVEAARTSLVLGKRRVRLWRKMMKIVPARAKSRVRWYLLGERELYAKNFADAAEGSQFIVIGGGQLIKNNVSLFCDRLLSLSDIAQRENIPFALVGVGVDAKMNATTWCLARKVFQRASLVAVRDAISRHRINACEEKEEKLVVIPDLAFALTNIHGKRAKNLRKISFAINVMSLSSMLRDRHGKYSLWRAAVIESYCRIIKDGVALGFAIVLFTSGSADDLSEAKEIRSAAISNTGIDVPIFHPEKLDELLMFLGDVQNVFAARMHAGILSYISGCNPVCISWDDKVQGVWRTVGEEGRVIDVGFLREATFSTLLFEKLHCNAPPTVDALATLAKSVELEVMRQGSPLWGNSYMSETAGDSSC